MSFKNIESNLMPPEIDNFAAGGNAKATARDYGMVAHLPIDEVLARFTGASLEISPGMRPFGGLEFGYSQSNIGDLIHYIGASQGDPLPRTARIGVGLNAGLTLSRRGHAWRIFSVAHLYEAEQLLVRVRQPYKVTYEKFLGDIDFWDNVILRKENPKIITKSGWELSFFETVSIRLGHYKDPLGKVDYDTRGFGVRLHGLLDAFLSDQPQESVIGFLIRHFDIQYDYGHYSAEKDHPLNDTNFHGVGIRFF
ncbi:MAG: hypothetical protein ONB44_14760 [candidate division KSB1 bacterium]|nr:hypothetical protein [candidate division KSB1 bacterium]MDZ7303389.1 hypothetical protein [candidate division KSB1 bacterium]MDZ7312293.1 hypothetical protein [candidate division KSB1 bacterium]